MSNCIVTLLTKYTYHSNKFCTTDHVSPEDVPKSELTHGFHYLIQTFVDIIVNLLTEDIKHLLTFRFSMYLYVYVYLLLRFVKKKFEYFRFRNPTY